MNWWRWAMCLDIWFRDEGSAQIPHEYLIRLRPNTVEALKRRGIVYVGKFNCLLFSPEGFKTAREARRAARNGSASKARPEERACRA